MNTELLQQARVVNALTGSRLQLTIPSILATGETFALRISCMGPDALPRTDFCHKLVFEGCVGVDGLPNAVTFDSREQLQLEVDGLRATGPDVAVVRVRVEGTGRYGGDPFVASNPAWVFDTPSYRVYWGDIHVHTLYSNCHPDKASDPEFCYQYAREVTHLDFAAAADHLRGIALEEGRWPRLQQLVQEYDQPGRFVPLLAFESSHAKGYGGDNNAYYREAAGPHFWVDRDDMRGIAPKVHLKELWEFLDKTGQDYMTVPHHTARMAKNRTFDEPYYDARREPLFEIYSGWGSSEVPPPNGYPLSGGNSSEQAYFVDALRNGCRYGVIASSDCHATLPGGELNHRGSSLSYGTLSGWAHKGLAALRAQELTRDSLWQAMTQRNTYATTLVRTLVDVKVGDCSMGQEMAVGKSDPLRKKRIVEVSASLDGADGGSAVLMRNGEQIAVKKLERDGGGKLRAVFEDGDTLDSVAVRGAQFHADPFVTYYVKLCSGGNFTQWTSPVWLDI